ncbi:hypothetical protein BCR33DRAFT_825535 [Rhizoclosmatium globosum]|uniref:BZIP domain-containing protein n=1 Tax=Rhizoclosmatium globosum TaxID=329046 RepID=A0A1Y2C3S5_9FUNG|nr:hypothetical protein BCR33DRAFT_825535 [Rhizoclosmatium globosum]|eukprot:ORY41651.1 hypothetical protein BCR33DRAFT_825535 [Rhizoclosmatium globosum]
MDIRALIDEDDPTPSPTGSSSSLPLPEQPRRSTPPTTSNEDKALKNRLAQRQFQERRRLHTLSSTLHSLCISLIPPPQPPTLLPRQRDAYLTELEEILAVIDGRMGTSGVLQLQQAQPVPLRPRFDSPQMSVEERRKITNRLAQQASRERKRVRAQSLEAAVKRLEDIHEELEAARRIAFGVRFY